MSSGDAAYFFAVVSEALADQQIARGLAERVVVSEIDWLEAENLEDFCCWRGLDEMAEFLSWTGILRLARERGIVTHGGFRSSPGAGDERRARLALLLFNSLERRPDAVVFVRDTDNDADRVASIERARDDRPWKFRVALATPHTKRECWILNGFESRDAYEKATLEKVRQKLGFDPCLEPQKLTAGRKKGKNNAKVILERDLGVRWGSDREEACWRDTDIEVLRERGQGSLLTAYLEEVAERLVPILAG